MLSGSLASHILGYIGSINQDELKGNEEIYSNDDYVGKTGIEYICEEYLRGQKGVKQIDMAVDGTVTGEYVTEEAVAGSTVVLTIDSNVQQVAETALKNNIEKIKSGGFSESYDAKSGAVVVMNVNSGEILALASYPDYEPQEFVGGISTAKWNEYNEPGKKTFLNRATQESYAPGSIFKMVSAIAALETGVTNTTETIYDTGIYPRAHKPKCWYYTDYGRGHGALNVMGAIKNSCNYFFYEMGIRMGIETLEKYARYFGLGTKTGVELLGETSGMLASKEYRDQKGEGEGYVLNAVIGQSDNSFSPIQMAKYISILANRMSSSKANIN